MITTSKFHAVAQRYPNLIRQAMFIGKMTHSEAASVVWAVKNKIDSPIAADKVRLFGGACELIQTVARYRNV
ncbi:hypothetical protein [Spirosoma sordidisoli]|uniref:Uncharacterized protein n=1 Tax=Spirosoma sordidisoli TaxID=2502893 RepID=A0A4Q2UK12_9BACT|nr:hypothetical protein [Spirosoma sordidisoli]RYC69594.1 hypothetical protein EQG79_13405 [Spirosoma sordidisoli]